MDDEKRMMSLVSRTERLAEEWSEFYEENDDPQVGAVACTLNALKGALFSGESSDQCLFNMADASAQAAKRNLAILMAKPN